MKSSSHPKFIKHTTLVADEMLHFDPQKERMENNAKADELVRRQYREHLGTPKCV